MRVEVAHGVDDFNDRQLGIDQDATANREDDRTVPIELVTQQGEEREGYSQMLIGVVPSFTQS